ncbi:response regulator transcription factor [Candidatus Microgenomates bacterium]|nr:response regulator transcription factor [Candidatus Microgenomates bacterium]
MMETILIVEDDKELQKFLLELLLEEGFSAKAVSEGSKVMDMIEKTNPDLILLDLGLPDIAGETVAKEIKKSYSETPVVMLTAKSAISDIVEGLNIGADDYITKPFVAEELIARLKARLRKNATGNKIKVNDLELDQQSFEVKRAGKEISLTPQEFKLLQYLMSNAGRVLTREMILNKIWLFSTDVGTRVVDVYIGYLRKKIDSGHDKQLIHSVRGFGYTIKE